MGKARPGDLRTRSPAGEWIVAHTRARIQIADGGAQNGCVYEGDEFVKRPKRGGSKGSPNGKSDDSRAARCSIFSR
jgi:hypothetical protein